MFAVEFDFVIKELTMSRIAPNRFAADPSVAQDVVGYGLRFVPAGDPAPSQIGDTQPPFVSLGASPEFDATNVPEMAGIDGVFDLYLFAYDDNANESDYSVLQNAPLDLVPPDAPANFRRA